MKENFFSRKMAEKSTEALEQIIVSKEFTEDARLAATWELEKRNAQSSAGENPTADEVDEAVTGQTFSVNFDDDAILDRQTGNLPVLYRKRMIYLFCILFSSLFGTVLYAMNLYRLKKMSAMYVVIAFGLGYAVLTALAVLHLPRFTNVGLIMNVASAGILADAFWDKQIGKTFEFERRSIVIPLLIGCILSVAIFYFFVWLPGR